MDQQTAPWGLKPRFDNVPLTLQHHRRWIVWAAVQREGGKIDKVPRSPRRPEKGIAWTKECNWLSYADACAAYLAAPHVLSGVGFVMNDIAEDPLGEPIVAIDIDHCVDEGGNFSPTAWQAFNALPDARWEVSPSGTGVRGFVSGTVPADVSHNGLGVEIYGGHSSRFVTVTGHRLGPADLDIALAPPGALERLVATYGAPDKGTPADDAPMPFPVGDEDLPDTDTLDPDLQLFLLTGDPGRYSENGGSSEAVGAVIAGLSIAGYTLPQIFALLLDNEHTYAYALKKRHNSHERARQFLWQECQRVAPRFRSVAAPEEFDVIPVPAPVKADPTTPLEHNPLLPHLTSAGAFARALKPIHYVMEPVIQRGYVHALTGPSNAGKTAIALAIAKAVAQGAWVGNCPTEKGVVLILAGENPQNVQMRCRGLVEQGEATFEELDAGVFLLSTVFPLSQSMPYLEDLVRHHLPAPPSLIIIDSKLVYFEGDSEDDNKQAVVQARHFRALTQLPGTPAVLVLCHPVKTVSDQQMLEPRGGSAFLNEIDTNLTAWNTGDGVLQLWWSRKIRGQGFAPIDFEQVEPALDGQNMALSGRPITTVLAVPVDPQRAAEMAGEAEEFEDLVLLAMAESVDCSVRGVCARLNITDAKKSRVARAQTRLKDAGLLSQRAPRKPYRLTEKGKKYVLEMNEKGFDLPVVKI